jgi:GTPase
MSSKVPVIAIVGRANVGKSSLFNALTGKREAIVAREPGTTRDSIASRLSTPLGDYWLVDTAGMKAPEDDFELTIQDQITEAAAAADLILVVIEAATGISEDDRRVAKLALKSKKPVLLVVNKADQALKAKQSDFLGLGIKKVLLTAATQKRGLDELVEALEAIIPPGKYRSDPGRIRLALLGRPNVGKSSLFNTLAKKQQAIVSDRAGTTRDVNRTVVKFEGTEIELLDTAGIRRSGRIERGIEQFSVLRALAAIEEADICLLLMDANELNVALDQKIAGLVKEAGKGLVLVVSKWDSLDKDAYTRDAIAPQIAHSYDFVPWAPLIFTSSETGQNVTKIFELAMQISKNRHSNFKTTELNKWLQNVMYAHPPAGLKNRHPKLRYMVHEEGNPIPSFKIFGSQTKFLHWSYKRYMDREFRLVWPMDGTPIKFWFIEQHGDSPTVRRSKAHKEDVRDPGPDRLDEL